ncbi:MAG: response regulator transcription factor, partial [Bacteroidales bacterium]|nr:response regulator transcription factor [Bacteroidales bacterium]
GYTSNNIASMINVDFNTVKFHKSNLFKKLEVKNSTEAIGYAIANGII